MGFLSLQILPSLAAKSVDTHKNYQRGKVWQSAGDTAMSLSNWKITEFLNLIHSPVLGQSMTEFFQESKLSLWSLDTRDWNLAFIQRSLGWETGWTGLQWEQPAFPCWLGNSDCLTNLVQLGGKKNPLEWATCYVEEVHPWKAGAGMGKRWKREYVIQRTSWAVFHETSLKRPETPQEKTRLMFQEQKVLIGSTNGPITWKSFSS